MLKSWRKRTQMRQHDNIMEKSHLLDQQEGLRVDFRVGGSDTEILVV